MSNGFVRHKVVQWVFPDIQSLTAYIPRTEGVYALDNYSGDIYLWNGDKWLLYADDVIKLSKNRRPVATVYQRLTTDYRAYTNSYTESVSGRVSASLHQSYYMDVDINACNFVENINIYDDRSFVRYKSCISSSVEIDGNGYVITGSLSAGSMSGSYYTVPSLSIA